MVWHLGTLLDKCVGEGRRGREERERQRDGREGVYTNMYINQGGLTILSSLVNTEKRATVSLQ